MKSTFNQMITLNIGILQKPNDNTQYRIITKGKTIFILLRVRERKPSPSIYTTTGGVRNTTQRKNTNYKISKQRLIIYTTFSTDF